MGLGPEEINGGTLLSEEEQEGLLVYGITTREQLDEHEQQNIEDAFFWIKTSRIRNENILTERFVRKLHKRMYQNVWTWEGKFRKTNKNLGIHLTQISIEVKKLLDDVLYWISNKTYTPEEIAIRFKHRLVSIHCFPNGNGRHSRLMADVMMEKLFNKAPFTWGSKNLNKKSDLRSTYIHAMKSADGGDIKPLVQFARS